MLTEITRLATVQISVFAFLNEALDKAHLPSLFLPFSLYLSLFSDSKVIYKVLDPHIHVKDPYSLDIQGQ